jgi:hypothetical protein
VWGTPSLSARPSEVADFTKFIIWSENILYFNIEYKYMLMLGEFEDWVWSGLTQWLFNHYRGVTLTQFIMLGYILCFLNDIIVHLIIIKNSKVYNCKYLQMCESRKETQKV